MYHNKVFCIFFIILTIINTAFACKGCVGLDEFSFEKILPHFSAVLVKFDVAFPYGDKHEIYTKLAEEVVDNKHLLIAEVAVKDYGEKDNEALAKRFGATKDNFPSVKLFKKDVTNPISFPEKSDFTLENLRSFIRDNTDIYLGLPGCVEALDKLATKFVDSKDQKSTLKEVEDAAKTLTEKEKESAKTYIVIMKKIIETGKSFIAQETERVTKLLKGKVSSKKQTELQNRLNILRAFAIPRKDEL